MDDSRVIEPKTGLSSPDWLDSILMAKKALTGKKVTVLVGSDLTLEEGKLLQDFIPKHFSGASVFHFGTPGVISAADDADEDGQPELHRDLARDEEPGEHTDDGAADDGPEDVSEAEVRAPVHVGLLVVR